MSALRTRSEHRMFNGTQGFYEHESAACAGPMRFAVYMPPNARESERVPVIYFLAGLTCTEETFVIKAGAQRLASKLGLAIVTCDTSPRATRYEGDDASWDFGLGASFYVDATRAPWSASYRMNSYVAKELPAVVEANFAVQANHRSIMGHSMGGHGALTIALQHANAYKSVSAFAPIVAPSQVPWGVKAFTNFFGDDRTQWHAHDAVELLKTKLFEGTILVDQGLNDKFLEGELKPSLLEAACRERGQPLELRTHEGYDHSYYFIASHVADHLRHHAKALGVLRDER